MKSDFIQLKIEKNDQHKFGGVKLKHFLQLLHFLKYRPPLNFSYVSESAPLLPSLSIKQNILLESISSKLNTTKDLQLKELIETEKNPYLAKLLEKIGDLDRFPQSLDRKSCKIVSLTKALLQKPKFLLLENPEQYIDYETLNDFKEAMKIAYRDEERIIVLSSQKLDFWSEIAKQTATRMSNGNFIIEEFRVTSQVPSRKAA